MATNQYRGLFHLAPRVSSTSFLYETATLRPRPLALSLPSPYRFQRALSTGNFPESSDEGANHHSDDSTQEGPEETLPPNQSDLTANETSERYGSFLRRRAAAVSSPTIRVDRPERWVKRNKTMTSSERKTIRDLLSQLEDQGIPVGDESTQTGGDGREPSPIRFAESKDFKQQQSSRSVRNRDLHETNEAEDSDKAEDILTDLYKLQLSDLGMADPNTPSEDQLVTISEAMDLVVNRELKKIEAVLFQALEDKGDAGVWEVCHQRIFSILPLLESPETPAPSGLFEAWPEPSGETTSSDILDIPALLPSNLIVSRVYPEALVVAFRVLSTHFPESPIIDEFRSTIKTKSPASNFLSTSSSLMADMIIFYWRQRRDLPTVVSFLRDIHNSGVKPNTPMKLVLQNIHNQHDTQMSSSRRVGSALHPFWDLPPTRKAYNEFAEPGGWMDKLKLRRQEQKQERDQDRDHVGRQHGLEFRPLE